MRREFLIFGRPRSRTAWMANFLTSQGSHCFHEGLANSRMNYGALSMQMHSVPRVHTVGNADTGMIHHVHDALEAFPDARLVMMTENEYSWRMFVEKHSIAKWFVDKVDQDYSYAKEVLADHDTLFLPCDDVTRSAFWANRAWRHCLGLGPPFSMERYKLLQGLNVQVIPEHLADRIK